jgi:hypothetical protein
MKKPYTPLSEAKRRMILSFLEKEREARRIVLGFAKDGRAGETHPEKNSASTKRSWAELMVTVRRRHRVCYDPLVAEFGELSLAVTTILDADVFWFRQARETLWRFRVHCQGGPGYPVLDPRHRRESREELGWRIYRMELALAEAEILEP